MAIYRLPHLLDEPAHNAWNSSHHNDLNDTVIYYSSIIIDSFSLYTSKITEAIADKRC